MLLRVLGSRRFTAFVLAVWFGLTVVWLVPFGVYGLPDAQIRTIVYGEPFFRAVYALVTLNAIACMVVAVGTTLATARRYPSPTSTPSVAQRGALRRERVSYEPTAARAALRAYGCRHVVCGEGWCWGVRHRWSSLGTVLFHVGLIVAFSGMFIEASVPAVRFQGDLVLAEGESCSGGADTAYIDVPEGASPVSPAVAFTVERVEPRFYRDILLFTSLTAHLRSGDKVHEVRVSHPWIVAPDTMVSITDFGYALDIETRSGSARESVRSVYKLKAFPAGQSDTIDVAVGDAGYRMTVTVFGDYIDRDGTPGVRSFNSDDPRVLVSVARKLKAGGERVLISERLMALGDAVTVPHGEIRIPRLRHYGVFRIVRDPLAPIIAFGLACVVVGVSLRLLLPRTEALVMGEGDGIVVSVRSEIYGQRPELAARIARYLEGTS